MRAPHRTARRLVLAAVTALLVLVPAGSALACGGLIAPNGTVSLLRTTTLAAYHNGVEHYVTSFDFSGTDAKEVGSIIPLPGIPSKVIKGGEWTLQRLEIETQPQVRERGVFALDAAVPAAGAAEVILKTKIDALNITVLKGGSVAVGDWAREHGFFLPPDAPEVLAFYATRSPIFMAVKFDLRRAQAQGIQQGQGTPVHVVIPTPNPWVPLRILSLGQKPDALVQADVYLLTDIKPATLPQTVRPVRSDPDQQGLIQEVSESASAPLMTDLRSDRGMKWMPERGMWLTYIKVNTPASELVHDLAIDASGFGHPDPRAAGYPAPAPDPVTGASRILWAIALGFGALIAIATVERRRATGRPAV